MDQRLDPHLMPNLITHPSHPIHPLTLFAAPPYHGGSFNCDGCGLQGTGFSYRCTTCDFDVHMICATNPLSLSHRSHPHQLNLVFDPPYQTRAPSCGICDEAGSNHWLYRCVSCGFDAHMDCANNRPSPQQQQQRQQRHQQPRERRHGRDNIGTLMLTMVQGFLEGIAHQVGEMVWKCVCGCD
ncbi:hypothetical protein OIU85_014024 [Salix viminalis]|uniref:DC1 domain-containing protein n=1 Tax=Salix viminalis TaxID=40686 RepID=A0A9Q0NMV7_SALVM|nr:hypothetical protein OIU85_014024 [Salix viminalis]